jgi:hypothetical protein
MQFTHHIAVRALIAAAVLATPLAQAAGDLPALWKISAAERASLPDSAVVKIKNSELTMGVLRAFHAERKQQLAQAAQLGQSVAAAIGHQRVASPIAVQAAGKTTITAATVPSVSSGAAPSTKGIVTPSPSTFNPRLALGNPVLMGEKDLSEFSLDYQTFCKAAKATACIYLPRVPAWADAGQVQLTDDSVRMRQIFDPLVIDAAECKAGNGHLWTELGCMYYYADHQYTKFLPLPPPMPQSRLHCPIPAAAGPGNEKMWTTEVSRDGMARVKLAVNPVHLYPKWLQDAGAKPTVCVLQVFMPL